ncbi:MAG TPA: AAA family ATPase [Desulfuromonadales bacterium]|nr:AAA family ATPase [Desulfuromonadales bacterium]
MAKKIFVSATSQDSGKTTISLSLLHQARKKYKRIGFIKPIGPKPIDFLGRRIDTDPATIAQVYGLEHLIDDMCPVVVEPGMTQQVIEGKIPVAELEGRILRAVERLDRECDFLIFEGAGHSGVGSVLGLSNARVAAMVGAPVLMVTGGGVGNVIDAVCMNLALYREVGAEVRLLVANKLIAEKREKTLHHLRLAFGGAGFEVLGGFNYQPVLANPTLKRVAKVLGIEVNGDREDLMRIAHHVQIGAASTQRVVDMLQEDTLLLVTSSRDELLVTLSTLYALPEYRSKIAGLVIPGVTPITKITQQILDKSGIPWLRTSKRTDNVFLAIHENVSKLTPEDKEKIALIQQLSMKRFDFDTIDQLFSV